MAQYRKLSQEKVAKATIALAMIVVRKDMGFSTQQVQKALKHLPEVKVDVKSGEYYLVPSDQDKTVEYQLQVNSHTTCNCPHCTTPTGLPDNKCWHKLAVVSAHEAERMYKEIYG